MVDLSISDGSLLLNVRGSDKLWAFKSSLEIPLQHVAGIRADPSIPTTRSSLSCATNVTTNSWSKLRTRTRRLR